MAELAEKMDLDANAVCKMDEVVQRNAETAEGSASASEEMSAQAEQVKNKVNENVFKIKRREVAFSQPKAKPAISHGPELSPDEEKFHWEMMIYRNFSYFFKYNYQ